MSEKPFSHQQWLAGHLAEHKLGASDEQPVRLSTPQGKPVVVHGFSDPMHGERVDVSTGSHDAGDLVINSTVSLSPVEGGNLPAINPPRTAEQAQALISDLRNAK